MTAATVTVTVTQEHIDCGLPSKCSDCPVAMALLACVPGATGACVFFDHAIVRLEDGSDIKLDLPQEASDFIGSFDDSEKVAPFSFTAVVTAR